MNPFSLRTDGTLDPIVLAAFALGLIGLVPGGAESAACDARPWPVPSSMCSSWTSPMR